jgi:hypothetical protein
LLRLRDAEFVDQPEVTQDHLWLDVGRRLADERAKIPGVKFTLHFVPSGGGDQEFSAQIVEAQRVPTVGEYVHIRQEGVKGAGYFRVILVSTTFKESASEQGTYPGEAISVLAEYLEGPEGYMSEEHSGLVAAYKKRGLKVEREPRWGY